MMTSTFDRWLTEPRPDPVVDEYDPCCGSCGCTLSDHEQTEVELEDGGVVIVAPCPEVIGRA